MQRHARGSSLIESLVALAVFAIGSAYIATWLSWSMAVDAQTSRSLAATTIATNLVERIRANRSGLVAGRYQGDESGSGDCAAGCNARALANDDVARFRVSLQQRVGAMATGFVHCEPRGVCRIRIAWKDRDELRWTVRP